MEWIRLVIGAVFLLAGLIIFTVELYEVFHMNYVLNRMQAAAMGDTLGISLSLVGLMIFSGLNMTTLKIVLIVVFLWFSSPVASHLLARLEVTTNEDIDKRATVYEDVSILEAEYDKASEKKEEL